MRVLIVDDHPMVLQGMTSLVQQLGPDIEVATASSAESALDLMSRPPAPALALLDIMLPDMDGFAVLRACRERFPMVPVVAMSALDRRIDIQRALDDGAMGFIPKASPPELIVNALRLVLAGGTFVPKELVIGASGSPFNAHLLSNGCADRVAPLLTPRQVDVLRLLMDGRSNKAIGRSLGCCEATVKAHVTRVMKALGVTNRTQAARVAEKLDLDSDAG